MEWDQLNNTTKYKSTQANDNEGYMYKKYHMHRKALARLMLWVNVVDITCALINMSTHHGTKCWLHVVALKHSLY